MYRRSTDNIQSKRNSRKVDEKKEEKNSIYNVEYTFDNF